MYGPFLKYETMFLILSHSDEILLVLLQPKGNEAGLLKSEEK